MRLLNRIKKEFYEIFETLFSIVPLTIGNYTRKILYKLVLKKCGKNFKTGIRIKIQEPSNISLGNNVELNYGVWIAANKHKKGSIKIGDNVLIGPYTILHSGNHIFKNPNISINKQGFEFDEIVIKDDVWIAARCTILSGVTIGEGSVIAAGSVITKDIPPFSVVAGVPGKIISKRE
jgi:acetyltransferase-like isoleucine patch superfamily enzyme